MKRWFYFLLFSSRSRSPDRKEVVSKRRNDIVQRRESPVKRHENSRSRSPDLKEASSKRVENLITQRNRSTSRSPERKDVSVKRREIPIKIEVGSPSRGSSKHTEISTTRRESPIRNRHRSKSPIKRRGSRSRSPKRNEVSTNTRDIPVSNRDRRERKSNGYGYREDRRSRDREPIDRFVPVWMSKSEWLN